MTWVWDMLATPSLEGHRHGGGSEVQESDGTWTNSQMVVKPMRVHGIVQEDM